MSRGNRLRVQGFGVQGSGFGVQGSEVQRFKGRGMRIERFAFWDGREKINFILLRTNGEERATAATSLRAGLNGLVGLFDR
jgi:hypothetical protein